MRLTEFIKGSGIYKVPTADLPDGENFIRNTAGKSWVIEDGSKKWKMYPLLHVCERDIDPYDIAVRVILCEELRWDSMYGHYKCQGCKKTFFTEEELGQVWADGLGTGAEIRC